jgi:aminotransferase in exopolysaccharide biosynthesis
MQKENSETLTKAVLGAIRDVVGAGNVALHEPSFDGNEWLYLKECLDSTFVSSVGKFVNEFESQLSQFTGAKHAIAVVNGTAALHVALLLSGVKPGDEVLVPSLTFVATGNAVIYCGATPHFIDSSESNLGINVEKLRTYLLSSTKQVHGKCINRTSGRTIQTLVPMHTFGHVGELDELIEVANEFNIAVVEDAAESLGSYYKNRHSGTLGLLGVISFNGNKIVTTGGGGMLLTNDDVLAAKAKHLTTTAKLSHQWEFRHDQVAFNYRMPNLNAALGCAQMERIDSLVFAKRKLYENYRISFEGIQGLQLFKEPPNSTSNYWLQTLVLKKENESFRDSILEKTNASGYMTRPAWVPLSELKQFETAPRMNLESALSLARRIINLPSSPKLAEGRSI